MPPLSEVLEEIISENYKRKISYDGRNRKGVVGSAGGEGPTGTDAGGGDNQGGGGGEPPTGAAEPRRGGQGGGKGEAAALREALKESKDSDFGRIVTREASKMAEELEGIDETARGHKQVKKYIKELQEALAADEIDMLGVCNALNGMMLNIGRSGNEGLFDGIRKSAERIQNQLLARGYEMPLKEGQMYHEGMRLTAEFVEDESLPAGAQVIKIIRKPQVNKDGKMVQAAVIVVAQNLVDEEPGAATGKAETALPIPSDEEIAGWSDEDFERYQAEEFMPRDEALFDEIIRLEQELEEHPRRTSLRARIAELDEQRKEMGRQLSNVLRKNWKPLTDEEMFEPEANATASRTTETDNSNYTIEPSQYTTKKGKVLNMQLVKFGRELTKEEKQAMTQFAREKKGWWDKGEGGFMMRDEASARELGAMLGDEEAIADNQPLSLTDVQAANDAADLTEIDKAINVEQEPQTTPRYDNDREDEVYDKTLTGLRNVINDRKRGAIPSIKNIEKVIRDLRKKAKTIEDGMATAAGETIPQAFDALANLNGKRRAYEQLLIDIRKKMADTERDDALAAHGVKIGDKVIYKGKEATIYDANHGQVTLDVGLSPVLYEVTDWDNVELPRSAKEEVGESPIKEVDIEGLFGALHKNGEAKLSDHTKTPGKKKAKKAEAPEEEPKQEEPKAKSKWVNEEDADRFEELRRRLKAKLGGQMNMGADPEILTIGVEMAYLMLKKGARKFNEFAKNLIELMGDEIRPYIKGFYQGSRYMPEMAEYVKDMTPSADVDAFDVMNFDKEGAKDIIATAEHIAREQEAARQAEVATGKLKQQRNEARKISQNEVTPDGKPLRPVTEDELRQNPTVWYQGKPSNVVALIEKGEQTDNGQFTTPRIERVYLTNGKSVKPEELRVVDEGDSESKPKDILNGKRPDKPRKQTATGGQMTLFGDEETTEAAKPSNANIKNANGAGEIGENKVTLYEADGKRIEVTKDWQSYMTPEAREVFSILGQRERKPHARPELSFISFASRDGVIIPIEALREIPAIKEAQSKIDAIEDRLQLSDTDVDKYAMRLLDNEHGSAVLDERGKLSKRNGKDDYSGEVKRERKAFIIIGRPAGGKSSVFAEPLSGKEGARIIDSDTVKPWLEGYDNGDGAGYVQDASSAVMMSALWKAVARGENVVIPKIGGGSIVDEIALPLKAAGYRVELYFNDVPTEVSVMRASARFAETGRYLSLWYLNGIGPKPDNTFIGNANKTIKESIDELPTQKVQKLRGRLAGLQGLEAGTLVSGLGREGRSGRGSDISRLLEQEGLERGRDSQLGAARLFDYAEWKSNDVAFGEKPKEIWNSDSGEPLPNNVKANKNDTARTRQAETGSRKDGTMGRVPTDRDRVLGTNGTERTGRGGTSRVSDETGTVADGTREGVPGQRSSGSASRGNNLAGEAERELSNGGRSLRNGSAASGRYDNRGTSAEVSGVQNGAGETERGGRVRLAQRGGRGDVRPSRQPEPKFKRNYLYPENSSGIDNMTPQQRLTANVEALEVVRTLMKEGREATPEEKEILGKYRGWGGVELGKAYSTDMMRRSFTDRWGTPTEQGKLLGRLADVIDELDPNGERGVLSAINRAALTSYYTPTSIARAMNRFAELAGFKGGNMLDPSMGNGVFEGTMSQGVQQRTMIHGVELDWLTGQIARNLYPDANVLITGYEQAGTADNAYDVVISNIPFGDISVTDKSWKHDSSPVRKSAQQRIHNYFAVKMLDNTRPGGLCVIMTSNAILDTKGNQIIREHLADKAEILGVVRLPGNTFKGAGTSVVTDVIFLRKYKDDADRTAVRSDKAYSDKIEKPFLSSGDLLLTNPTDGKAYKVSVNGYFTANKGMMIGEPKAGGQYRADQFGLGSGLGSDELASAMSKLIENNIVGRRKGKLFDTHKTEREVHEAVSEAYKGDGNYVSSGNIVEQDGMFGIVTITKNKYGDGISTFTEMPSLKAKSSRIRAMLPIREAMKELIASEIGGEKETFLEELRKKLQGAYDGYVKKFGRLNDKENDFLTEDIDGYTLRALERWKDGKFDGLSDIFTKNTIKPALDLSTAKTPADAISLSLAEYGEINPSFMEDVLGESWAEQCGDTLFRTPFTEDVYETADAYLSGDVKTKLEQAREAAKRDKSFERNVEALEAVQPKDIPFEDISIRMGARWIPVEVYTDFMYDMFGIRKNGWKGNKSGVEYMPEVDRYVVNVAKNELGGEADAWRTSRRAASEVFTAALQDKSLSVFDTIEEDGKEIKVFNKEETELLNGKIQDLRTAFEDWLSQNPEREEMLMRMYNDKFNRTVLRKYNGSHLNIPGLMGIELRPHQKDAVWMLIQNRGGIVDHIVGAGKTLVMQGAIMEMRRMGIAKKPMIIGLKATVAQIAKEFREAFPAARILAPTEKDFSKENRKRLMSQIALNDYDCVILSHDQYDMLPHTEEVERGVIDEQMRQLDAALEYLYGKSDKGQLTKKQIKGLEKRKANLEAKLAKLLDRKIDREFTFEGLGVDYLFVDECQHFKSLPYVSTYDRVAGLGDKKGSQKSIALLNGVRYLQKMHQGDRGTVFLSGTTISNSLSEIYHLLNYLRPSEMERLGMTTFDAWAANFAIHTTELEYGVTNELKEKDRFRSLTNMPELSKMYSEIADVRNDMNLKLPKPKMRSHVVTVPQSETMRAINREIVNMVKNKDGHYFGIDSKDTTPWGLLASTLSAKAAINPRLIDDTLDDEGGKIPAVCENVKKIYDQFSEQKGTQLIFCDTGVPIKGKKYDAYTDIINRLVNDYGIPREEIADIHEADTDEKRKALFAKMNEGAVRILIGGTKNMGTGVNVQMRISAMHHVDVPWTPADREQREGRGVRQGNIIARDFNGNNVDVYFYATEGSLDMYKYQLQETKGKLFAQFKSGAIGDRTFDEGDAEGDFDPAEVVAMLSGNPVIFEKSKQDKKVEKLRRAKRAYESDWQRRRSRYEELKQKKRNFERLLSLNANDVRDLERGGFTPDEGGKYPANVTVSVKDDYSSRRSFDKPKEAGEYIHSLLKNGKKVQLQGFNQNANISVPITEAGLFGKPIAELERYGGIKYTVEVSDDDTAAGVAFRNLLQKVYSNRKVYERNLEDVNNQLTGADPGENKFPKQAELDEAIAEKKRLDDEYKKLADEGSKPQSDDDERYRLREEEPPKKTGIGYKVFVLKDGKLYPPMVANPNGEATPVGVWLDADAAPVAGVSKTGRQQVKAGGKGTQGGSGKLAYRPGWHLGEIPYALQFNRVNPETGQREMFPANFVWAEVEYADDVNYNDEARSYGVNANGNYQHSLAGLPRVPENGSYKYRTNPDPKTDPWIISGAMKVNRILTPSEVDAMVRAAGREPQPRQEGAITDEQVNALNEATKREAMAAKREAVEAAAEKLHTRVNVIEDVKSIKHSDPEKQAKRQRSKGWIDLKTGEINIVLENCDDVDDAVATTMHETVAHKGLRELIGEERYQEFLDTTYEHLRDELKKGVDNATGRAFMDALRKGKKKSYEECRREAVDELFGRLAEKPFDEMNGEERTLWKRLKAWARDLLDKFLGTLKLPSWFKLSDNELRYMLWRSKERLERGKEGVIDTARDIAKRAELGLSEEGDVYAAGKRRQAREATNRAIEEATSIVTGKEPKEIRRERIAAEAERRERAKYMRMFCGVTLIS